MKERPIIFSGPMVRAILAGLKTQTRRVLRSDTIEGTYPVDTWGGWEKTCDAGLWIGCNNEGTTIFASCPYGDPGDRLWVRETWRLWDCKRGETEGDIVEGPIPKKEHPDDAMRYWRQRVEFAADHEDPNYDPDARWRSPIYMPRWASRLTLEVTEVRARRLDTITDADAEAEGFEHRSAFFDYWRKLPKTSGADWVWVVSFRRMDPEP